MIERQHIGVLLLTLLAVSGCATTGSTLGSGVGDRLVVDPPYYAGRPSSAGPLRVAHLPIRYQRGGAQEAFFDPAGRPGTPVAALLAEMDEHLSSLAATVPLAPAPLPGIPPDVQFGCEEVTFGECERDSDRVAAGRKPWMRLAVARPSPEWLSTLQAALDASGADAALVVALEVGQYWTQQKNLLGVKEVRLGTGYDVPVPWLTSLDQPVQVLQLTGALVDRQGQAVRIGAEGLPPSVRTSC